jgi:hypothetical protein
MKKKVIFASLFAGLLLFTGFMVLNSPPVFAQEATETAPRGERMEDRWGKENISELYYVNVPIEKVYPYRLGYVVLYRKGNNELGRAYLPYEWFRVGADQKAELIQLGDGKTWPCMSVFYKEGAFHAVRLYVSKRESHLTWGNIPSNVNLDDRFQGVETVDLSSSAEEEEQQ